MELKRLTPPPPAIAINGSASASSRTDFSGLRCMRARATDDLEMAEFFGADIHQKVFPSGIFAVQALHGILHGGREFAVGAPELFQQHVAEARIGFVDPDCVHEFFDVMIHLGARLFDCLLGRRVHGTDRRSPLPRKPMDALPKGSCRRSSFDYDYYAHAPLPFILA